MFDFERGELLLIDKPKGWTSFDVVQKVKNLIKKYAGVKVKVGHSGTLDPLATGLLLLATGKMTKQISLYQGLDKEYETLIVFGATTPSYDADTPIDKTYPKEHITDELLNKALEELKGEQWQTPPAYSAKRISGKRSYDLARKGEKVELKPVKIFIKNIKILDKALPDSVFLQLLVSKGTYIRSFAYDLGKKLNSGAYVKELRRTAIGEFSVKDALTILQFEELLKNIYKPENQ